MKKIALTPINNTKNFQYSKNKIISLITVQETLKYLGENKMDLVGMGEAEEMRKTIGAINYIECSAKNQENIKNVFHEAIRAVLSPKPKLEKEECNII